MSDIILVGVTEKEYNKSPEIYKQADPLKCLSLPPDQEEIAREITTQGIRHLILGVEDYTGPHIYKALPSGAVIVRHGVGYDGINLRRATTKGILCANTPGTLKRSVAEHTLTLLLAIAKQLNRHLPAVRDRRWPSLTGIELHGETLAIIGTGNIGNEVARMASQCLGMHVIGLNHRFEAPEKLKAEYGYAKLTTDFTSAVSTARFVSLHLPANSETANYLDDRRLDLLPGDVAVINTARGALIDEIALYNALREGDLGAAALDVFQNEPYRPVEPDMDLRDLENVIMTPHVASSTAAANHRMARRALRNIKAAQQKEYTAMDLLNPELIENGSD